MSSTVTSSGIPAFFSGLGSLERTSTIMYLVESFYVVERQHNKSILWESQSSRTSPSHNRQIPTEDRYAPTTSHSDEETDNFYNTIDTIPEKQIHYTIVMGDFNANVGGQTNTPERATGCFGLGQRNERGDTLVRMGNIEEFQDHEHTISEESREEMDMEKP